MIEAQGAKRCFGELLRLSRERAALTQEQLAKKVGLGRVIVANYESGKASPEPDRAVRLADILNQDPAQFLLLSSLQRRAQEGVPDALFLRTINRLLAGCKDGGGAGALSRGLETHLSLLDFPESFMPIVVVVGDKREDEPKNAGDLFVFSASTVDDRWLLGLGLPRGTEKMSDKVLMTADQDWLEKRFGHTHILCIGSPASNLFVREFNDHFLFRFAMSTETTTKWRKKRAEMRGLDTLAALSGFRENSKRDLKQTMRLFKQSGFVDFNFSNLKLGIDPAENRDFAVVSLGRNPFAKKGEPFCAILAAGVHHPGTAHAVKFLGTPEHFERHPFGGILEVQVPSDEYPRDKVAWHDKIKESAADWHIAGGLPLGYKPSELRDKLENQWIKAIENHVLVTDVDISVNELKEHIALIDLLAAAKQSRPHQERSQSHEPIKTQD